MEFKESSAPGGSEPNDDKKPLPGSGVNLYDPAATASRWLTRRFGIVGGLGFVALLASVEGGEILRAVLEDLREGEGTNEEFSLGPPELGLVASDSRVGGGATPKRGDFTGVNVVIADADTGDVYVDTKKTKRPIAFTFERRPLIAPVCPALEEGVRTMRRGGVRKVLAPAAAGFGERGVVLSDGTRVPPNEAGADDHAGGGEQLVPVTAGSGWFRRGFDDGRIDAREMRVDAHIEREREIDVRERRETAPRYRRL